MAENNTNNTFQHNKVTTSGMTLFDEAGLMLRLSYLDDSLSLVIGQPSVDDSGKRKYPQEMRHPFIITIDRATALYTSIIPKVMKALEDGEDYNGGVFLNKAKTAIFEIRVQSGDVYLIYYKNIGSDRKPGETFAFKCQRTQIIESYNPDGSSFDQSSVEGYFAVFCKYIESGIYDLHCGSGHSVRKATAYMTTSIFNYLKAISAKLGVTVESSKQYQSSHMVSNGFMDIPDGSPEEIPFAPSEPVRTSMDGLLS